MTAPRIEAGDWVRPRGSWGRAVGKVLEGDYEPGDGGLRAARVELEGSPAWFFAGNLERLRPDEEARLCEEAQAQGLLDEVRAAALTARLRAFRAGRLEFVRTPRLLDGLWALSSRSDPDLGSAAITRLLDRGAVLLGPEVEPEPEPEPELARATATMATHRAFAATAAPGPCRSAGEARLAATIVDTLDVECLGRIAAHLGLKSPRRREVSEREHFEALLARVPVRWIVSALDPGQLRTAARAAGLGAIGGPHRELEERLLALALPGSDPDEPLRAEAAELGRQALAAERAELDRWIARGEALLRTILAAFDRDGLAALAARLGLAGPPSRSGPDRRQLEVLLSDVPVEELVGALDAGELRAVARAAGLRELGPDLVLRVRLVGHADPHGESPWWWW